MKHPPVFKIPVSYERGTPVPRGNGIGAIPPLSSSPPPVQAPHHNLIAASIHDEYDFGVS